MRWYFVCVVLCASTVIAAESSAGIDKVVGYKGTWKIEIEHFNTRLSKAAKESTTLRNDCWRSAGFFVCDQFVNGESKDLMVFTYDPKDDTYNSHTVPVAGSQGGGGKFTIKGNVWTFPWQVKQDGKTIYFQVLNTFTTHSTIEYLQEFSEDNVHWTVTAKGIEHKVEGAR
jgi:hypothetical protein